MVQVIGIDEVGRGCWAGPLLVVAARTDSKLPGGLTDSKLLTKNRRRILAKLVRATCDIGEGWVQPEEIDVLGLANAMKLGVKRCLADLGANNFDKIIIDGNINYCPKQFSNSTAVIKADLRHSIVSAASIYAKVKRDAYMTDMAKLYPAYGFDKHVGYGTALHRDTLRACGVSLLHRKSFKPVRQYL